MKHFEEILSSLGAVRSMALLESDNWTLWQAEYQTPVAVVKGNYLYLKSRCPLSEANSTNLSNWKAKCPEGYQVIVTPKSDLARDLNATVSRFKAKNGNTTQGLLEAYLLNNVRYRPLQREEHFVPPSLARENQSNQENGLEFLTKWLVGEGSEKSSPIGILCADGGIGKTTLARELCESVRHRHPKVFPLLIESDQWKNIANSGFTLDTLWDIAISRRLEHGSSLRSNPSALRVLMQEGLLVVIFDGFDELAAMSADKNRPQDIISELRELFTPEDEEVKARVILTSRSTYWTAISQSSPDIGEVDVFKLSGFDNEQRKEYFHKRLADPAHRDLAMRIAKEVSGALYSDSAQAIEGQNADRVSGTPFVLSLIAHLVEGDQQIGSIAPYSVDPLEPVLLGICRRENIRQQLTIPPETQISIFEEVFRAYDDNISVADLDVLLQVFDISDSGERARFANHFLLTRFGGSQDMLSARYEVLKIYFVARFLAKGLQKIERSGPEKEIAVTLAKNSLGQSQVNEWLAAQLRKLPPERLNAAIRHAYEIISDPLNALSRHQAAVALSHLISLLVTKGSKEERAHELFKLMVSIDHHKDSKLISKLTFAGKLRSFDFADLQFSNCTFVDVSFSACKFSEHTVFENCRFEGTLEISSCEGASALQFQEPILSPDAELALSQIVSRPTSIGVRQTFADEALTRALRKFKGDAGFHSIQARRCQSGSNPRNPYNQAVWNAMRRHGIIEQHTISGVTEGGYHIRDDREIKRQITQYLDNGIVGPTLQLVLDELIN